MNVLITREREKYQVLADKLNMFGINTFSLPMIECTPVPAIISGEYDFGVFTSLNSVKYFGPYKDRVLIDKIVAVGPSTAEALLDIGLKADIIPETFSSEGMKELFLDIDIANKKFLFPGAKARAGNFHEWLDKMGAKVAMVTTYTTRQIEYEASYVKKFLKENEINIITFASPSAAKAMLTDLGEISQQIVCIGKTTADEVRLLGYDARYPDDFTLDWMVKLIRELS